MQVWNIPTALSSTRGLQEICNESYCERLGETREEGDGSVHDVSIALSSTRGLRVICNEIYSERLRKVREEEEESVDSELKLN